MEARGVRLVFGEGINGGVLAGSGNKGPLSFFLRRGRRKKVVVVETVWVVVVEAYRACSPRLPSDRDDSESLEIGKASDEFDSSPYGGGPWSPLAFSGSCMVTRDSRPF